MSNSFQITFTDPAKNDNGGITVPEQQNVPVSNLSLIGRNYPLYGQAINQNFLSLLENFANPSAPPNSIEGQLWYDSYNQVLKVNDAVTGWIPVNGVYEQELQPTTAKPGDIWVETDTSILYIFNGSNWILVGPTSTSGTKTGAYPTTLKDTKGSDHNVIIMYLDDIALEIISKEEFTPASVIPGFNNLSIGVNISSVVTNKLPTFNGVAKNATALQQIGASGQVTYVAGNNFLRTDTLQASMRGQLIISNDDGVKIGGTTSTFVIQKSGYKAIFANIVDQGRFDFQTYAQGSPRIPFTIDNSSIGNSPRIGVNTPNPSVELDVTGSGNISNNLTIKFSVTTATLNYSSKTLLVGGDSLFFGSLDLQGSISVTTSSVFRGPATFGSNLLFVNSTTNVGSTTLPAGSIIAKNIGVSTASWGSTVFYGSLRGSATSLAQSKSFSLSGPIKSITAQLFNGTANVTIPTTVTNAIIDTLNPYPFVSNVQLIPDKSDLLMVYSSLNGNANNRIFNVSKTKFLGDVYPALSPTGAILPFAGTALPTGWAWCDGQRYNRFGPDTNALYNVIGIKYGTVNSNDFLVPNLNGANNTGYSSLYTTSTVGTAGISVPRVGINYIIKL